MRVSIHTPSCDRRAGPHCHNRVLIGLRNLFSLSVVGVSIFSPLLYRNPLLSQFSNRQSNTKQLETLSLRREKQAERMLTGPQASPSPSAILSCRLSHINSHHQP